MIERCTSISHEVWRGRVFVEFKLSEDDVLSSFPPRPFYVLSKRISYLPLISTPAIASFRSYAVDLHNQNIWFEYSCTASTERVTLRSDLPLGVLYDSLVIGRGHESSSSQIFKITIHFTKFPIAKAIRCWSNEMMRRYYFQSLKQAVYTLHGNTKIISSAPNLLETCSPFQ